MAPLFDGSTPVIRHEAIARRNADGCVGGEVIGRDSFFVNGARRLFAIGQIALSKHGRPRERNLPALARLVESDFEGFCKRMVAANDAELSPVFRTYLNELDRDSRAFGDILQTVIVETSFLRDPAIAASLSESDFRFAWLAQRLMTIAICLPLDLVEVNGKLCRLMVSCCLGELQQR
jgi:type IV secretory pathway TraG/TraD family ATPase VirD4